MTAAIQRYPSAWGATSATAVAAIVNGGLAQDGRHAGTRAPGLVPATAAPGGQDPEGAKTGRHGRHSARAGKTGRMTDMTGFAGMEATG